MHLAETICRLRTAKGLSQGDLAEMMEVSRQSVSKWETGGAVPELDKLIKLSQIFGVSLDELVGRESGEPGKRTEVPHGEEAAGRAAGEADGAGMAAPAQPATAERPVMSPWPARRIVGIILLCFGTLVWLLLGMVGGFLPAALYAAPFLLCGIICLVFRRNCGLWCGWALFFAFDLYLRLATGITWRLVWLTSVYDPSMNYLRLLFAWLELLCLLLLLALTIFRFRNRKLVPTKKTFCGLAAAWLLFVLTYLPLTLTAQDGGMIRVINLLYTLRDWGRWVCLAFAATYSVRLLRSYGTAGQKR